MINDKMPATPWIILYLTTGYIFLVSINFGTALMIVERLSNRMSQIARIDALSGCLNRLALEEIGATQFNKCRFENRPLSLILLDADRFKALNDNFGHEVGDEAIKIIASNTEKTVAEFNTAYRDFKVARFGGEEFVVVLSDTPLSQALNCRERIRRNLQEHVTQIGKYSVHLTISAGVSSRHDDDEDFSDMMKRADLALYSAKAMGRNCVVSEAEIKHLNPNDALVK